MAHPRRILTRRVRLTSVAFCGLLGLSCGDPTDICGCSPPVPTARIEGRVIDAEARLVGSATISVAVVPESGCLGGNIVGQAKTDIQGRFVVRISQSCPGRLFEAWAEPPQGSPWLASPRSEFSARFWLGEARDTVRLELILPIGMEGTGAQ